jgi:hypothetical protein
VSYYGDSAEGPGRWIGQAPRRTGSTAPSNGRRWRGCWKGRHPHTGARLLTARGSSQRMHLATGTAACFDELGWPLYTVADAARLLGVAHREIDSVSAASASSLVPRIVCETRRRVPSTGVNSASIRHTSARSSRNPLDGDRRSASSSLSHGVEQYAVFVEPFNVSD